MFWNKKHTKNGTTVFRTENEHFLLSGAIENCLWKDTGRNDIIIIIIIIINNYNNKQEFVCRDATNVKPEMYDCTSNN